MESIERKLKEAQEENIRWEQQAKVLFSYQNGGIEAEREGHIEDAITMYTEAYKFGQGADRMNVNNYFYSLERLCIIYRRQKRYADEVEIIRVALAEYINDKDRERLAERLVKVQKIQAKEAGK